jgi:outer membrane lipopolysaccharide assembly protein LptE/RlpB
MHALLIALVLLLTACEQRYRYACQNPDNWESKQCQKPLCEVNQDCPEHVFNGQKSMELQINKEQKIDCAK